MRILWLGINYWPEETGIGVFNTGRCEYLAGRGHQVTVCTAMPFYPQWRVPAQYRGRLFQSEIRNAVRILRCRIYVPLQVTAARRILHEASFITASCLRAMAAWRPELIFVVSPPLGLAVSSLLLSRLWRVPYVFHVADLQPDAALDLGMLPREGRVARFLFAVERLAYGRAAAVSTLTEAMRQRIIAKGIKCSKVTLFPDWADPALFAVPSGVAGNGCRRRFGFGDQFLVLHAGNMGVKQGLDVVLGSARLSRSHRGIRYLLVGDGAVRSSLEASARNMGLENVTFLPLQPKDRFLDLLAAAGLCLVTQQKSVADIVFPSKVLTILAAGRPVIASVSAGSEVARVVREAGAGVVVEPENAEVLAEAVVKLSSDRLLRQEMGERGRAYAREHWDRERTLPRMEAELSRLLGLGGRAT